jgi:hypothetical protein
LWVPSSGAIAFDQNPAVEKFLLVMTQDPLDSLPIGEELKDQQNVPVPPELFQELSTPTSSREDAQFQEGEKLTPREGRGVKLQGDDPAPARILINRAPQDRRIVASLILTHR